MLRRAAQSFHLGDSARTDDRAAWQTFFAKLEACAALEAPWTLVLQDPLANSFVSSVVDDPRADPRMVIEARAAAREWDRAPHCQPLVACPARSDFFVCVQTIGQ